MKEIELTRGQTTIVDQDVFDEFGKLKWTAAYDPHTKSFYAKRSIRRNGKFQTTSLHRLIMNAQPGEIVDHINHDTLDNRRENLRIVTRSQNKINRKGLRSDNKSGYHGVYWDAESGKWRVQLNVEGRAFHLGRFADKHEAAAVYNAAAIKYHGEFARLNVLALAA